MDLRSQIAAHESCAKKIATDKPRVYALAHPDAVCGVCGKAHEGTSAQATVSMYRLTEREGWDRP